MSKDLALRYFKGLSSIALEPVRRVFRWGPLIIVESIPLDDPNGSSFRAFGDNFEQVKMPPAFWTAMRDA